MSLLCECTFLHFIFDVDIYALALVTIFIQILYICLDFAWFLFDFYVYTSYLFIFRLFI